MSAFDRRLRRLELSNSVVVPNHLPLDEWTVEQLDAGIRELLPEWGTSLGDDDLDRLIAEEKARIAAEQMTNQRQ